VRYLRCTENAVIAVSRNIRNSRNSLNNNNNRISVRRSFTTPAPKGEEAVDAGSGTWPKDPAGEGTLRKQEGVEGEEVSWYSVWEIERVKKVEASETRGGRGAVDQAEERGPRPRLGKLRNENIYPNGCFAEMTLKCNTGL